VNYPDSVEGALVLVLDRARDGTPPSASAPTSIARALATHQIAQWASVVEADIPRRVLDSQIAEVAAAVAQSAVEATRDGAPSSLQLAREIVSNARASYASALAQWAAVTHFVWRTRRDGRVRPDHAALHGRIFRFDRGAPGIGLPGAPYGCRCSAEPVRR
jgi:SPP1 gp7 family putative phage head morphogenesis protein